MDIVYIQDNVFVMLGGQDRNVLNVSYSKIVQVHALYLQGVFVQILKLILMEFVRYETTRQKLLSIIFHTQWIVNV